MKWLRIATYARLLRHFFVFELSAVWGALLGPGIWAFIFFCAPMDNKMRLSWLGACIQLSAVALSGYGFLFTKRLFEKPSYFDDLRRKFPRWPGDVTIQISGQTMTMSLGAVGAATMGIGANLSDAQKITALIAKVDQLEQNHLSLVASVSRGFEEHALKLQTEMRERQQGDKKAHSLIDETTTGGLIYAWVGLFWVALGQIVSALQEEWAGRLESIGFRHLQYGTQLQVACIGSFLLAVWLLERD